MDISKRTLEDHAYGLLAQGDVRVCADKGEAQARFNSSYERVSDLRANRYAHGDYQLLLRTSVHDVLQSESTNLEVSLATQLDSGLGETWDNSDLPFAVVFGLSRAGYDKEKILQISSDLDEKTKEYLRSLDDEDKLTSVTGSDNDSAVLSERLNTYNGFSTQDHEIFTYALQAKKQDPLTYVATLNDEQKTYVGEYSGEEAVAFISEFAPSEFGSVQDLKSLFQDNDYNRLMGGSEETLERRQATVKAYSNLSDEDRQSFSTLYRDNPAHGGIFLRSFGTPTNEKFDKLNTDWQSFDARGVPIRTSIDGVLKDIVDMYSGLQRDEQLKLVETISTWDQGYPSQLRSRYSLMRLAVDHQHLGLDSFYKAIDNDRFQNVINSLQQDEVVHYLRVNGGSATQQELRNHMEDLTYHKFRRVLRQVLNLDLATMSKSGKRNVFTLNEGN